MVREEIIDRLVCAKYMFENGVQTLDRGVPYAAGLAVLAFQDAVEMTLRAIAEHIHAQVKENSAFNQILDEIDKVGAAQLTHRTALLQLNTSRNSFKHKGLAPRDEDAQKFRRDLEGFLPNVVNAFIHINFDSLSLVSLVRHRRTRNWLEKAESRLTQGKFHDAIVASAIAEAIFRKHSQTGARNMGKMSKPNLMDMRYNTSGVASAIYDLFEETEKQFQELHERIELMGIGISGNDYARFRDLTPSVSLTLAGTLYIHDWHDAELATYEQALFCCSFARNTILKIQQAYRSDPFVPKPSRTQYRTTRPTEIIVYPVEDADKHEVIEIAEAGRILPAAGRDDGKSQFVTVFYQGESAYLLREVIEVVSE